MSSAVQNSLLSLASAAVSMVSGFMAAVIVARLLGAEGAGLTAFGFWVASCAAAVADRGYPQAILRRTTPGRSEEDHHGLIRSSVGVFLPWIVTVFAVACALIMLGGSIGGMVDRGYWLATALLFLVYCLSNFSLSAFRGLGDFRSPALNTVWGCLLFLPLSALGALLFGAAGAILALATRYLPQAVSLVFRLRGKTTDAAGPERSFHTYRRQMWLNDMISVIALSRLEYLFLVLLATETEMGHFAVAIAFAGLVEQLALQLSSPLIVSFSLLKTESGTRSDATDRAWLGIALPFVPIAIGGAAIAPVLVPMVYGADFADTGLPAALMLLAGGLSALSIIPWTFLAATGHASALTGAMLLSALVTIVAAPVAIVSGGNMGLAIARLLVEMIVFGSLLLQANRREGLAVPVSALARIVLSAAVCGLVALAIVSRMPSVSGIVLAVIGGAVVYAIGLKMTRALPRALLHPISDRMAGGQTSSFRRLTVAALLWISAS